MGLSLALGGNTRTAWHVENDKHAAAILAHHYPGVPNHGDLTAVDWTQVEPVDWLTAGFPCTDVSHAGKRAGLRPDTRTGLWFQIAYAIGQLRPRHVLLENVRGLLSGRADRDLGPDGTDVEVADPGAVRALGVVLGDLADLGFDARWVCVQASDAGAPHGRARVFIVATDTESDRGRIGHRDGAAATDPDDAGRGEHRRPVAARPEIPAAQRGSDAATDAVVQRRRGTAGQLGGLGAEGREPQDHAAQREPASDAASAERRGTEPTLLAEAAGPAAELGERSGETAWGVYAPAVARWQPVLGRPAPRPTGPGRRGERLSPQFVEFLMGLPDGWVTAVPGIPRNAQLRALGNGCVPQQVALALHLLGITASERVA